MAVSSISPGLKSEQRTGGQLVVDMLVANGITHAFGVPGESYLAVLDALRGSNIHFTVCRQEGGAAMMAEAAGKLTGLPGICFVTRGPGATNASAGVHVAMQDSTPMILFIGQVERGFQGREAFQEIDYEQFFGPICKWAAEIRDPARIPEYINRAFATAMTGRPGPVVLSLPEDMLTELVQDAHVSKFEPAHQGIDAAQMQELEKLLHAAKNPLIILGGSTWSQEGCDAIADFAARWQIPVAVSFRRQSLFSCEHPCFAGHIGIGIDAALKARIDAADVLLLIGGRLSEMPSQSYTLLDIPQPRQKLVHVYPGPMELGRVYAPTLGIVARGDVFAHKLGDLSQPKTLPWATGTKDVNAAARAFMTPSIQLPGDVQLAEIVKTAAQKAGPDAIICNGAGNYAGFVHRFHPFTKFMTQLAPTSGSMGYGLPAAVAAKRLRPSAPVICYAGDGCLMMTVQELATAVQEKLPIIVIVVDNGMYGTIRMHQEKHYPGRDFATALINPDFALMAKSFGTQSFTVRDTKEFAPAFDEALASSVPTLIHIPIDPDAITPTMTLSAIRDAARKRG